MKEIMILAAVMLAAHAGAETQPSKETTMIARGTFEVKVMPQPKGETDLFAGYIVDKEFAGDFTGSSKGQMLAAETPVQGSAAYVAFESATGNLQGKQGSFLMQHKGNMQGDSKSLDINIVPDSGTGELKGISGTCKIIIDNGKHFYELQYSLPE